MKRFIVCTLLVGGLVLVGCEKKTTTTKSRYSDQSSKSMYQDNQFGEQQTWGNMPSGQSTFGKSFYQGEGKSFYAVLSGSQEVPAVSTIATGTALLQFSADGTKLNYRLMVTGLKDPTEAHIHWGVAGQTGPPVAPLRVTAKQGAFSGLLAEGTISPSELFGPMTGKEMSELMEGFNNGNTYVNVHTKQHPEGEIRGQIKTGQPEGMKSGGMNNTGTGKGAAGNVPNGRSGY